MNGYFKGAGNVLMLILVWVASILVLGVAARVAKELFCLGYGC